jgi:threonine dehydratase
MSNAASNWQPDLDELRSIHAAAAETVKRTPVFSLGELSRRCGGTVVVKAENMQRTGSFKLRGSMAKLAGRDSTDCRGVVAGSAGNHGQALAYAARARDSLPCTVFMPEDAAISKVNAVTAFGA